MSVALSIDVTDRASGLVDRLALALGGQGMSQVIGRAVVNRIQSHFRALPVNRQFPARTTGFWKAAARSTHYQVVADGVLVSVNKQGIRQRLFGGTIRPVRRKFLTIPAREEAYGKVASDFNNLRFAIIPGVGPALVEADATRVKIGRKRKDGSRKISSAGETGGAVMFWLKRSVTQRANPNVLPTADTLAATALQAAGFHSALVTRRGGAA